jgi:FixH
MQISWGLRVAILYVGFVSMLITMAILSSRSRTDLERIDYYEEELKHDEKMQAMKNMNELEETIRVENTGDQLRIIYPESFHKNNAEVELWVYKPSNSSKDKRISFVCEGKEHIVQTKFWDKGIYFLRFSTKTNSRKYFFEKEISIK